MAHLVLTRWRPDTDEERDEETRKRSMVWCDGYDDSWYINEIKASKFTFYHIPKSRRTEHMFNLHELYWIL